jgi:hypothetical protein
MGFKPIPTAVSVLNWQGNVLITSASPRLQNSFWGGYWKQTYHLNSWNLGRAGGNSYYLLLPDRQVGFAFTGMLLTEFGPGGIDGNWQNWIDFTLP